MLPVDMKKLIRRHYDEVLSQGKFEIADLAYASTAVIHDPALPGLPTGPQAIKELAKLYRDAFPDCTYVINDIIVENDLACVRWTATGTHKGNLMGIPPTGKFGTVTGLSLIRFEKDQVVEVWAQWDVVGMLKQLGVELPIKTEMEVLL